MSLGLPSHLASQAIRRSFILAQHTVALTLLSVSAVSTLVFQSARQDFDLWPAVVALLPAIALFAFRKRLSSQVWALFYLLVASAGAHLFAIVLISRPTPVTESDGFSFIAVKVAIIMVGGSSTSISSAIAWAFAGYVVAELAVGVAMVETGMPLIFDVGTLVAFIGTAIIISLIGVRQRRLLRAQPRLRRAAEDEQVAELRSQIEVRAAALMHDTVLNDLAAITASDGEWLDRQLREQLRKDSDSLIDEEWLSDAEESRSDDARSGWQTSGLFQAVLESRAMGLIVETTGDLAAVSRLASGTSIALGLAVKQCLVNVVKHSGVMRAEIAVYGSDSTLSVMIVDNGRGFAESSTGVDRLGLRNSVRKRIESFGGEVDIWSTPGRGTSIVIKVPANMDVSSTSTSTSAESL